MSSRGVLGRDRLRRDIGSSRFEDSSMSSSKRGSNPPSRHLWVGNLSHSLGEHDLTDQFLQFGDLDSVAFQPGRSYAFLNFKNDDDAIAALKALQGFPLAGNPLRIEYAKAEKATVTSRDEDYLQRRDDQRAALRGSPFSQKDSRVRNASPEPFYGEKSKISDRNAEPSEVLWIGFPALLKVDEMILKKAFSPFGEIEKITVFPGRSYAFVRFRNIISACRAKETLQGKLFGNPRVHICFARSEGGSSSSGRSPLSPHLRSNGHLGAPENFRHDRNFGGAAKESSIRSPHFMSNLDSDSDVYGFNRKGALYPGGSNTFDNWRFGEELGPPPDAYERRGSPPRERPPHFDDFPQKIPRKASYFEEPWDLAEDSYLHGAKKLKTGSFPPENELPEYNLSDLEQEKRSFPRAFSDFSPPGAFDKNYGYTPQPDQPNTLSHTDRSDHLKASYDNYQSGSGSMLPNPVERKRFTPEPEQSSFKLWKWEGTIAKGGAPVCHAHAFPVGKALDMMLPEFLDCTARTGLDMLAKHYYQAASAWVVFFAPASDADIGYYNEFMHYLEEKQRAAVAKLDDKTTLFLVPPSDFSEKVLRVPGKLCISGVILRLELPNSNFGPLHHLNEKRDTNLMSFHGDAPNIKPSTPLGHFSAMEPFANLGRSGGGSSGPPTAYSGSAHAGGRISDSYNDNRHNYPHQQRNPIPGSSWSPHHPQNISRNTLSQAPNIGVDPIMQEHHSNPQRMMVSRDDSAHYTENISSNPVSGSRKPFLQENKPSAPPSLPISGLQPQQLAQLASSLLGQQGQGSNPKFSVAEDIMQTNTSQLEHQFRTAQSHGLQNNQVGSEIPTSMFGQLQQQQHQQHQGSNVPVQREHQGTSGNPQMQTTSSTQEEADGDPQKRLQATLQLAAALLQQIQQGKGT
ncbi:flowering time control protein FPA [Euphorbia lathyris]|uniref:flowering time control protein FPA n=1 Tax=Euphorbia lathyris TaxID=212925 RepID=UPI003314098E